MKCPHCQKSLRDLEIFLSLSPTEKRVMVFLMTGKDVKEMAMNYNSARGYLHRIFVKTGMSKRSELMAFIKQRPVLCSLLRGDITT